MVIEQEIETVIEKTFSETKTKRQFEKFSTSFETTKERKKFIDALDSSFDNLQNKQEQVISFPESKISNAVNDIITPNEEDKKDLLEYTKNIDTLKEDVQNEIISWADNVSSNLSKNNPFIEEENFINSLKEHKNIQKEFEQIKKQYNQLPSVAENSKQQISKPNIDFTFYSKQFSDGNLKVTTKMQAVTRTFIKDLSKELERRKTKWEINQIEQQRKKFIEELYQKIAKYRELMEKLKNFSKMFGRLWDLSSCNFNDYGFEVLEEFADLISHNEELQKLSELIGRHVKDEQNYKIEKRMNTKIVTEYTLQKAYKGQIQGLKLGNDLSSVLKTELALFKNPATKKLFMLKFAQKQLLSYEYQNEILNSYNVQNEEEVQVAQEDKKGPILICVDTSGSMNGAPERIAKTITFALAQKAFDEDRSCYLISFSTTIETLDLTQTNHSDGLTRLVQFLRMSFNGGTDATPALNKSLELIKENVWKNADVLVVSDLIMDTFDDSTVEQIKITQENKTKFYSLVIGNSANPDVEKVFNQNWLYNTSSRDAGKELLIQLDSLSS